MRTVGIVVLLLVVASAAFSQDSLVTPGIGRPIRMRLYDQPVVFEATFSGWNADSVWFRTPTSRTADYRVPRSVVTDLETPVGYRRHTLIGAAVGAGVTSAMAIALIGAWNAVAGDCPECQVGVAQAAPGVITAAAFGGLIGAGVGTLVRTDRWQPAIRPSNATTPRASADDRVRALDLGLTDGDFAASSRKASDSPQWFLRGLAAGTVGSIVGAVYVDRKARRSSVPVGAGVGNQNDPVGPEYRLGYEQGYVDAVRSERRHYALWGSVVGMIANVALNSVLPQPEES